MNFKLNAAYMRWLAFGHMHNKFEQAPGNQPITINGIPHKVKHKR